MHVRSVTASEIRHTLEAWAALVNGRANNGGVDVRAVLAEAGFPRAAAASAASVERLEQRLDGLAELARALPVVDDVAAMALVNEQLTELDVRPSVVEHDGVGAHMHWTPATATFDDQVITDIVMALAQEVVASGSARFGRCAASDCEDVFYDGTRNRSRRFCDDPRCASRTHTADHRARRRANNT